MSSTSLFSITSAPRDRRTRVLKTHIIIHILILGTAILLLMQFISYTTAAEEIDIFSMPPPWEEMFAQQFTQGTDLFIWVADYLLVPLDGLHALLCMGWYADRLHPVRTNRHVGGRRRAIKSWWNYSRQMLEAWRQQGPESCRTRDGAEDPKMSEHNPTQQQATPYDHPSSHQTDSMDNSPPPFSSISPPTYHPSLQPTYNPLAKHILLALWDMLMILTLSSHIFVYASNIQPGLAFCEIHDFPLWHFHLRPSLTLKDRCRRINWGIHSAGGCSATGAAVLALWHFCALVARLWDVVDEKLVERLSSRKSGNQLATRGKKDNMGGIEMSDWQHPPRDVDVRSRGTMKRSSGTVTLTGTEDASKHIPTVSQEEMGVGMGRRRRGKREETNDVSSNSDKERDIRGSSWEGFLECLA